MSLPSQRRPSAPLREDFPLAGGLLGFHGAILAVAIAVVLSLPRDSPGGDYYGDWGKGLVEVFRWAVFGAVAGVVIVRFIGAALWAALERRDRRRFPAIPDSVLETARERFGDSTTRPRVEGAPSTADSWVIGGRDGINESSAGGERQTGGTSDPA
jgi:hypothetical protein